MTAMPNDGDESDSLSGGNPQSCSPEEDNGKRDDLESRTNDLKGNKDSSGIEARGGDMSEELEKGDPKSKDGTDDNETHSVSKESSSTDKPCSTDSNENKAKSPIDERKSLKRNLEANTASIQDVDNLHPIKRARSAYFIFQSEKRGQIKAENAGASIGSIAKIIGKLWSELSSENKKRYQEEAAKEKEEVAKAKARRKEAGLLENNSIQKGSEANDVSFPIARIKKICRLDPEVKGLSKEAVHLITKAAEEFTMKLGKDTFAIAQMNSRKTILPDDVADVCSLREPFLFLNEDIRDLVKKLSKEAKVKRKEAGPSIIDNSTVGVKPLTSYFGAK